MGFEPTTPLSQGKRLAGARTRPLCDPSAIHQYDNTNRHFTSIQLIELRHISGYVMMSYVWK